MKQSLFACLLAIGITNCSHAPVGGAERDPAANSQPVVFDLIHTSQVCNHPGHQPTWCDGATDTKASVDASGLEKRIVGQLERARTNPDKARVYAAEFSFSDKPIQQEMCALGKAGVPVDVYLDQGSAENIAFLSSPQCQKDPSHPNAVGHLLGGFTNFPEWRLHHNKTVFVDAGDGSPYDIDFSSGNLSTFGASLHFDHWVLMKAKQGTNIGKATLCLFQALDVADKTATKVGMYANGSGDFSKDPVVMKAYTQARQKCFSDNGVIPMNQPEKAVAQEKIAPFFTPPDSKLLVLNTLKGEMDKVRLQQKDGPAYLYIAIEHFTQSSLAAVVNAAANAGVDVRIILNSGTISGSEVAADKPFYDQNFKKGKVKVRFIETNPGAGGNGQQMHNKFAILNGKRVFSGAGHYTTSGMDTNFETLYLTEDDTLTQKYLVYFQDLWSKSVDEAYLVKHTPPTPPPPLAPSALDLIGH